MIDNRWGISLDAKINVSPHPTLALCNLSTGGRKTRQDPRRKKIARETLLLSSIEDAGKPTHHRKTSISPKASLFWGTTRYLKKKRDARLVSRGVLSSVTLQFYEVISWGHRFHTLGRFVVFGCISMGVFLAYARGLCVFRMLYATIYA